MREHSVRSQAKLNEALEHRIYPQELIREFGAGDLELDDLAEVISQLLGSPTRVSAGPDSDLLSPRRRGSHVLGGGA